MFDIIILLFVAGFIWKGVRLGFIESLGGILGIFIGLLAAGRWWPTVASSLEPIITNQWLAMIGGWLLVFIVVNRVVALVFWLLDKMFHIIAIIPFLKSINSLLGGLLGLIEGFLFIGAIISISLLLPFSQSLKTKVDNSRFLPILSFVDVFTQKLTPDSVKAWKGGQPILDKINQLKNNGIEQLNPFKDFGNVLPSGLDYLQKQFKTLEKGGATTTIDNSGSFDSRIPSDAFEPTPVGQ
jgi:uncharacterized membrane protein required for colicin V production